MKLVLRLACSVMLAGGVLLADVTYQQTTKYQGGTLIEMVQKMASIPMMGRMMGGNQMKQAFEDQRYDIYVKGNKMARWGQLTSSIYDLDAGTITTIDNTKKTYRTATFEEMQRRAEEMQQRMNRNKGGGDLQFDVKAERTGQTRVLDGETAQEMLITMTAKQATAQGQMVVTMDAWLVPIKPGTKEVEEFQRKLTAKYAYAFASMGPAMASAGQGLSAAMQEAMKQDGYPALTDVAIKGVVAGGPMGGGDSDPNAPLIKVETQTGNFAEGAVDDSKFVIPAGYKEDKHGR
jgi:hypothetical protein